MRAGRSRHASIGRITDLAALARRATRTHGAWSLRSCQVAIPTDNPSSERLNLGLLMERELPAAGAVGIAAADEGAMRLTVLARGGSLVADHHG